ncbi:protein of unknown function [Methanoculleus bourgensis]|uniref:Uncharacterized protein n=1 Tax=Methanoculleus bourgensis TaxID=83986 RepID=A0A0X3BNJ2_9EURY|nr:protein of unknown function [Methanoculleus bourgensis]
MAAPGRIRQVFVAGSATIPATEILCGRPPVSRKDISTRGNILSPRNSPGAGPHPPTGEEEEGLAEKKDFVYVILAIVVVLVIALVIKPAASGELPGIQWPGEPEPGPGTPVRTPAHIPTSPRHPPRPRHRRPPRCRPGTGSRRRSGSSTQRPTIYKPERAGRT